VIDLVSGSTSSAPLPTIPRVRINSLPALGGKGAGVWTGSGQPGVIPGQRLGDEYVDLDSGDFYELEAGMTWTLLGNIKGPAGDTELSPAELEALASEAAKKAADALGDGPDLVLLLENALA
jgi:hypothetical protein